MPTPLPPAYAWLAKEKAPKILVAALPFFGLAEIKGDKHNPEIIAWAKALSPILAAYVVSDEIPWCALFISHVCQVTGLPVPKGYNAVRASGFEAWGTQSPTPMLGDVLVFERPGGGHVGLYVGEDADAFHVFGGNQGDKVSIVRIEKKRLKAARRTAWAIAQPANVRRITLSKAGALSANES